MSGTIRCKGIVLDSSTTIDKKINLSSSVLTISSGEITITTSYHTVTPESGPNDDLDTINGGVEGDILYLRCAANKEITLKSGTGNLNLIENHLLSGGSSSQLFFDGTNWSEISVITNKGPTLAASNISIDNSIQPNEITLIFSKNLESTSAQNTSNYVVTNNSGSITYTNATAILSGKTVTLTLAAVNPDDNRTFITTTDANAGIKVTPTSSIVDILGSAYTGATVFDNGSNVTSDSTAPNLPTTAIKIDNANQPNTIALTFSEKLDKTTAEGTDNFTVTNNDNSVTYSIASSSLNNTTVTLTLNAINTANVSTYITNTDANTGINVLPTTSLLDVSGYAYGGALVTGSANDTDHVLDSTAPTLATSAIKIDNSAQPNTIELTFNEKLAKAVGEVESNWVVKNNSNGITYNIANAAITNNVVTLTLSTANGHNTSSYITTTDANTGLRVTPNTNITDVAGITYAAGEVEGDVNDSDHVFDETGPSINLNQIEVTNDGAFKLSNRIYLAFNEKIEKTQAETINNWNVTNTGAVIGYSLSNAALATNGNYVTLRLVSLDTANASTYITNSDANAGLIVTASNNITDLAGNQFNGVAVTESGASHTLNTTAPTLAQSDIQVDTTVRPHMITLTFDEPMDKTLGEDKTNWTVIGGSNATSYNIASASVSNEVVTLTLSAVDTAQANSYITSNEVSGIKITPSVNLTNIFGASYTGGQITESGATHNPDVTAPTLANTAIIVDNVSNPQTVTLTFSEPLRKIPGEITSNWNVTNTGASQGYTINTASVNNTTVVLTLPTADPSDTRSYITNNHANGGLVITPDTNIIDVYGVAYAGGAVTGVANESNHNLNLTAPVLLTSNIDVTNTNDTNHSVQLEFSQKIEKTQGETTGNMIVENNSGGLTYSIKEISVANQFLTITLSDCTGSNTLTYITNNHATEGLKVTPSVNITNLAGINYSAGQVIASGGSNSLDNTAPSASLAYNAPSIGAVTKVNEGSTLTITATFTEKIADAHPPQIQHASNGPGVIGVLNPTLMTKTSDTEWFYNYTVPSGNGSIYPTLVGAKDLPGKDIVANPTSGTNIYIDNTAPTISAITPSFGDRLNLTEDDSNKTVLVTAGAGLESLENGQNVYIKITDDSLGAPANYVHMNNSTLLSAVSSNNATITLNVADLQALTDGKTYSISVVNANDVTTYAAQSLTATTDLAGNNYIGTTSTQFTYDVTRPTLPQNNIQVNNAVQPNQITLTFTEELTTATANNVSNYTVKDNSNTITYGLVSANKTGNAVTIQMDPVDPADNTTFITTSAIGAGIRVTPSTNLQDLAENTYNAGPVLESGASHTTDSNNPTFLAGDIVIDNSVQPNTIAVTFDQKMNTSTVETENNWTVTNNSNGIQYSIANASISANTVTLTLANVNSSNNKTFITTSDITNQIRVTSSTNITNVVGTASLGAEVVAANSGHTLDTTALTLSANNIVVDNTSRPQKVTITFSEAVDKTTADTKSNWTLGNGAYTINTAIASNADVVLTLHPVDSANSKTYITNTGASGITVTPSANIVDLCGANAYSGNQVTESGATHVLDSTGPILPQANIQVNNSVQPNLITLTFNEELDKTGAELIDHWTNKVKNNSEAITYQIASSSADNAVVTLTLAAINPTDNTTFITNNDATAGIKITPNTTGFKDISGNAYSGGVVTESGASHTTDNNQPTFLPAGVVIDNAVQPNTITVTFDQKLDLASAETEGNWGLTDNAGAINYSIANAALSDNVVTLTLVAPDYSNNGTYITTAAAGAGIKITPTTSLLNVVGKPSAGAVVTAQITGHTLDSTSPTLAANNISVNTAVRPNTISVTFSEAVTKSLAENTANWAVANSTGLLSYTVASASANNDTVVLTISAVDSSDNSTFILNTEAPTIRVTPSVNITDLAGTNAYASGAVTASGGSHTLDSDGPTLPAANIQVNNSVQPNQIVLTFDEPVDKAAAETVGNWNLVKDNSNAIAFNIASASADNAVVTLTLATINPTDNTSFITNNQATAGIRVAPNSTNFKDVAGVLYSGGLVVESGASHTVDNNPPSFLSTGVVIDNAVQPNTITITFDQKLDLSSADTEGNWGVTDNGGAINYSIANAALSDNVVTLTLANVNTASNDSYITTAAAGAGIKITPTTSLLNVVGKPSAGAEVTAQTTGHTTDSTKPTLPQSNIVINNTTDPNTVTVTFSEKVTKSAAENTSNWTLTDGGSITYTIASASANNETVTLTLPARDPEDNKTFITNTVAGTGINVTPSTNITDVSGVAYDQGTISESGATHTLDSTGPTLNAADIDVDNSVQPNTITLEFSEKLEENAAENTANWLVKDNGNTVTYGISTSVLADNIVTLTLVSPDTSNTSTYITNNQATNGLRITPSANLTDLAGIAYSGAAVVATGGIITTDNASPTASLAYNISGIGVVTSAKEGEIVRVTATFNELIADSPTMQIEHAANGTVGLLSATNMTKSNGTSWYYDYTIPGGNGIANLTLATGTDLAGKAITAAPTSGGSLTIDNNAPSASLAYNVVGIGAITHARQGQTVRITATLDQAVEDSPILQIQHASSGTVGALSATNMTKVSTTEYYYDYTIPVGDGTVNPTLSTGVDSSRNVIQATPTSGTDLVIDNTAPSILSFVPTGVLVDGILNAAEYATLVPNGTSTSLNVTMNPAPNNIEDGVANSSQILFAGTLYKDQFSGNTVTVGIPDNKLISTYDGQEPSTALYPLTVTCTDKAGNSVVDSSSYSITINKF